MEETQWNVNMIKPGAKKRTFFGGQQKFEGFPIGATSTNLPTLGFAASWRMGVALGTLVDELYFDAFFSVCTFIRIIAYTPTT